MHKHSQSKANPSSQSQVYQPQGIIDRLDMEDIPIGSIVRTPSGRVGRVVKHRGAQSRHDLFQRVIIEFDEPYGDSVALQPHLLTLIQKP